MLIAPLKLTIQLKICHKSSSENSVYKKWGCLNHSNYWFELVGSPLKFPCHIIFCHIMQFHFITHWQRLLIGELQGDDQSPTLALMPVIEKKPKHCNANTTDCTATVWSFQSRTSLRRTSFTFLTPQRLLIKFLYFVLSLLGLLHGEKPVVPLWGLSLAVIDGSLLALNTNGFVRFTKDESTKLLTVPVMSLSAQLLLKLVMLFLQDWTSEEFSGYLQT